MPGTGEESGNESEVPGTGGESGNESEVPETGGESGNGSETPDTENGSESESETPGSEDGTGTGEETESETETETEEDLGQQMEELKSQLQSNAQTYDTILAQLEALLGMETEDSASSDSTETSEIEGSETEEGESALESSLRASINGDTTVSQHMKNVKEMTEDIPEIVTEALEMAGIEYQDYITVLDECIAQIENDITLQKNVLAVLSESDDADQEQLDKENITILLTQLSEASAERSSLYEELISLQELTLSSQEEEIQELQNQILNLETQLEAAGQGETESPAGEAGDLAEETESSVGETGDLAGETGSQTEQAGNPVGETESQTGQTGDPAGETESQTGQTGSTAGETEGQLRGQRPEEGTEAGSADGTGQGTESGTLPENNGTGMEETSDEEGTENEAGRADFSGSSGTGSAAGGNGSGGSMGAAGSMGGSGGMSGVSGGVSAGSLDGEESGSMTMEELNLSEEDISLFGDTYDLTPVENLLEQEPSDSDSAESFLEQLEEAADTVRSQYAELIRNQKATELEIQYTYDTAVLEGKLAEITYEETLEDWEDTLQEAQTAQEELEEKKQVLESMEDGIVTAQNSGLIASVNYAAEDVLSSGTPVLSYYNTEQVTVTIAVPQEQISEMQVGDTVEVTVAGRQEQSGTVTEKAMEVQEGNSRTTVNYEVTITMENENGRLTAGSSASVTIDPEQEESEEVQENE